MWNIEIELIRGVVSKDYIHILISTPPTMSSSEIMRRINKKIDIKIFEEHPHLKKKYWCQRFCVSDNFCLTAGELTKQMIEGCFSHYFEQTPDGNFEIE